jgi:transposase-like protein
MARDKKIQVLLSSEDEQKLNRIITSALMHEGKLIVILMYVRDLILHHIAQYEGQQTSFVNEHVKKILNEYQTKTKSKNILR